MEFGMYNKCEIMQNIYLVGIYFVNTNLPFGAKSSKIEFFSILLLKSSTVIFLT